MVVTCMIVSCSSKLLDPADSIPNPDEMPLLLRASIVAVCVSLPEASPIRLGLQGIPPMRAISTGMNHVRARPWLRCKDVQMNLFNQIAGKFQDVFATVTLQHVLVLTQMNARSIYETLLETGVSEEALADMAQANSICGSARKSTDAKLAQLRGLPGELTFRRGEMAPEFEKVAFNAPLGVLQPPFQTQFGWHVVLVNQRTGEASAGR